MGPNVLQDNQFKLSAFEGPFAMTLTRERLSVVLPTYNERENIPPLLKELLSMDEPYDLEILIVDDESTDEMVLLRDIEFHSMCEHHMLPFHGTASIAYIPNGKIVGISKLAR